MRRTRVLAAAGATRNWEEDHGRDSGAAPLAPSADLPADAHDADVDRPSGDRRGAVFRDDPGRLVADRCSFGTELLRRRAMVPGHHDRAPHPVRLYLGTDPSCAGRRAPPDLGHRARARSGRTRMARARDAVRIHQLDPGAVDRRCAHHRRSGRAMKEVSRASLRTPLGHVRGLGSAKSGTQHFWHQRLTSVALVPLSIFFVVLVVALIGLNHAAAVQILGSPGVAILMLLFILTTAYHMHIGMQE